MQSLPIETALKMAYLPLVMNGICIHYAEIVRSRLIHNKWSETKPANRELHELIHAYKTKDVFKRNPDEYLKVITMCDDFVKDSGYDDWVYRNGYDMVLKNMEPKLSAAECDVVEYIQVALEIVKMCIEYEYTMKQWVNKQCNLKYCVDNLDPDPWKVEFKSVLMKLSKLICGKEVFDSRYTKMSYDVFKNKLNALEFEPSTQNLSEI